MSRLGKYVCALYVCLSIVLGGLIGYYKFAVADVAVSAAEKKSNGSDDKQENVVSSSSETVAIKAELTAYCNCSICSEAWGSQTAMQTHTRVGVVATPKEIPLGSKIYIPDLKGYKDDGVFNVEDRGGAVIVKRDGTYIIDVWLPTHEQVKEFGRKKTTIYLLK